MYIGSKVAVIFIDVNICLDTQHISNKYNTCTVVTSPVYIGSKVAVIFIDVNICLDTG